jgi:thioredoxin 1
VHYIKIDVDELPELSQELGIRAMPTFIHFENGEKAGSFMGAHLRELEKFADKVGAAKAAEAKNDTVAAAANPENTDF